MSMTMAFFENSRGTGALSAFFVPFAALLALVGVGAPLAAFRAPLGVLAATAALAGAVAAAGLGRGFGGAVQLLDGLPDSGDRRLAVRELFHRLEIRAKTGDSGEAVPNADRAIRRPVGGERGEFLFAGETFLAFRDLFGGGVCGDVIVCVDCKKRHCSGLLSTARSRGGAGEPPIGCESRVRLPDWFRASRRRATRR
jgi:hypothetical protein